MDCINPLEVASRVLWGNKRRDPVLVLPVDVVEEIFEHSIEDIASSSCRDASRAPLQLCLVSKRWRNIALGMPSIWRFIAVNLSSAEFKSLNSLQRRILRTANLSLVVELNVSAKANLYEFALLALFAKSNRISELSFCPHKGMDDMWRSRKFNRLTVLTCVVPDIVCDYPAAAGCTMAMARLFRVHGRQLRSLSIPQPIADIPRLYSIFAACPNLQFLSISFVCGGHYSSYHKKKVLMSELTHLSLKNLCDVPYFLDTFRAPMLTSLTITSLQCQTGGQFQWPEMASCVEAFLKRVPSLKRLELCGLLSDENRLLGILSGLPEITHLSFRPSHNSQVITGKTFEMLTIRRGDGTNVLLPRLEELVIHGQPKTHIQYSVVANMIKSRSQRKFRSEQPQNHGMLKSIDIELPSESWWTALRLRGRYQKSEQTVRCSGLRCPVRRPIQLLRAKKLKSHFWGIVKLLVMVIPQIAALGGLAYFFLRWLGLWENKYVTGQEN